MVIRQSVSVNQTAACDALATVVKGPDLLSRSNYLRMVCGVIIAFHRLPFDNGLANRRTDNTYIDNQLTCGGILKYVLLLQPTNTMAETEIWVVLFPIS
jgi:hypothetical protein